MPVFIWPVWVLRKRMQSTLLVIQARWTEAIACLPQSWFYYVDLILILPVAHFLGFLGISGGAENWTGLTLFHRIIVFCLLSSLKACIFHLKERKGITFLLHGVKNVDSVVWSFLYVQIPLTLLIVKSKSTMSVSKLVLIDPKIK